MAGHKNSHVITVDKELAVLTWENDKTNLHSLGVVDEEYPGNRLNDGKCDPSGRLLAGI